MKQAWLPVLICVAGMMTAASADAQSRPVPHTSDSPTSTEDQRKAQEHFQRARELYQAGKYSETIAELEVARRLDPNAKDLVMNLGIVHEKLGAYDEAVAALRSYVEMDGVTAAERAKAEAMIKRIEGARTAAPTQPTVTAPTATTTTPETPTATPQPPPAKGRIDALTIGAAAVAGVALVAGTSLGIYAVSSRPDGGFVTGRDGSYAQLRDETDAAHTAAVVADVSFVIAAVAAIATAGLYFGRPKVAATTTTPSTGLTLSPSLGIAKGALFRGTF